VGEKGKNLIGRGGNGNYVDCHKEGTVDSLYWKGRETLQALACRRGKRTPGAKGPDAVDLNQDGTYLSRGKTICVSLRRKGENAGE